MGFNETDVDVYAGPLANTRRDKLLKTAAYYLSFITFGSIIGVIGPTLPELAVQTGTKLSQISYLFTAHSLGYLAGSFFGGRLHERVKGHPLIGSALVIMAAIMMLIPLTGLLLLLICILFIIGVAEGVLDVGCNVLVVRVHGDKVDPYMSALHFFFGFGAFIAPIIVAKTMTLSGGITWAYWFLAFLMFPLSIIMFLLKSPAAGRPLQKKDSGNENSLPVLLITAFFFIHVGTEISFGGWIYTYAVTLGLAGEAGAAYLTSGFWGALTLGRLLSVPISMRLKPRSILIINMTGCVAAGIAVLSGTRSVLTLWAGTLIMGLSIGPLFATSLNFAERNVGITSRTTGWFLIGGGVAGMLFPWLIGQFFESKGPVFMPVILLIACVAGIILLLFTISVLSQRNNFQNRKSIFSRQ
jgi:FHS family Na+ dependent glucose MFS transporter 1